MTIATYDDLARASRRRLEWSQLTWKAANSSVPGFSVVSGNSAWESNSTNYIPFPASTATTGDNPTSYLFAGTDRVDALDADAFLVDGGWSSDANQPLAPILLADLLWNGPIVTTVDGVASTFTPPTLPARDANGSSDGVGVVAGFWAENFGSGVSASISYTNSAGTSGRTSGTVTGGASQAGGPWRFPLQAGDAGVRSVQSVTTTGGAVQCRVALFRRLAAFPSAGRSSILTRIPAGAMLFPFLKWNSISNQGFLGIYASLAMDY